MPNFGSSDVSAELRARLVIKARQESIHSRVAATSAGIFHQLVVVNKFRQQPTYIARIWLVGELAKRFHFWPAHAGRFCIVHVFGERQHQQLFETALAAVLPHAIVGVE